MSGYVLGSEAELDLDALWDYIADDSVDAADRWIEKLFPLCAHLQIHHSTAVYAPALSGFESRFSSE